MLYRLAADSVLLLHLSFIAFVILGSLLVLRWRWLMLFHIPAAVWGTFVELTGRFCPLTIIENELRREAGIAGYEGGFIEHYLLPVIYPNELTPNVQLTLGLLVLIVNAAIYAWLFHRPRARDHMA
jgi:hypothetical protein